jgi:hypothetical protein
MKKRIYLTLLALLTAGSVLLLNGCSLSLPEVSTDATLSSEAEILVDGNVQLYSRWYNSNDEKLAGAVVSFYDGKTLVFEGTTDENGMLQTEPLPGNTELTCIVTDASGSEIANTTVIYKISDSYSAITVYTIAEDSDLQQIEVPADKTILSAAIYVTEDGMISHANLTQYIETTDETSEDQTEGETSDEASEDAAPEDGADAEGSAEGNTASEGTDEGGQADTSDASTDTTADESQAETETQNTDGQ